MAKWLKDAVFYEIYPQSFQDTNADGIGDFQGIIDRLDYIKELGCNAIWMNPCFESPFGDAGYDVSDYYTAAPRYGTNGDLKIHIPIAISGQTISGSSQRELPRSRVFRTETVVAW